MTRDCLQVRMALRRCICSVLVAAVLSPTLFPGFAAAQSGPVSPTSVQSTAPQTAQPVAETSSVAARPSDRDRRRAARLYLDASKLFMAEKFEDALKSYNDAAQLDPANPNYRLAGEVARNHAVIALVQAAAKDRLLGNTEGARTALMRALKLDPKSVEVSQHMYELGDDAARQRATSAFASEQPVPELGGTVNLEASPEHHDFHIRSNQHEIVGQVFKAYGIDAMVDESVRSSPVRLDIDDASFDDAVQAACMVTHTFFVPLDAHRVVVADDTPAKRLEFTRLLLETIYLPGLKDEELTEVSTLAKQVFNIKQADIDHSARAITVRAPKATLEAFNSTLRTLTDGHDQVVLDVKLIQIAHNNERNLGVQPPQSFAAYNVYAEEQSILTQNADLVQEIISSGLAAPGDTLAIIGILIASGQVSSSLFSNGLALFGGGITTSALAPGPATANFSFSSSDSRQLDSVQLRLGEGETGTLKLGQRYPIQTSSFSSLSSSVSSISGLTTAGNSGSLSSILASLEGSVPNVPQVQYQDLGLTLKSTANVMRDDRVALTIDLQVTALSGASLNDNPILNNRLYSGIVTIKEGTAVVVVSDMDKSESRAVSGTPGLSEIPGMSNVTDKDTQKSYATLVVIITPHVVRYTQPNGHTPMLRIERASQAQ